MMSAEERRRHKELEEARKAGLAAPEVRFIAGIAMQLAPCLFLGQLFLESCSDINLHDISAG